MFRQKNPGLEMILRADKLLRQQVAEFNTDDRDTYATFSEALLHTLANCKYLWNDARSDMEVRRFEAALSSPVRGTKRPALEDEAEKDKSPANPKLTSSAKKRLKLKAKLAGAPGKPVQGGAGNKGQGKGAHLPKPGGDTAARIPDAEWKQILAMKYKGKPRCKFFNSSKGCTSGAKCSQEHSCLVCGESHSWFSNCRGK